MSQYRIAKSQSSSITPARGKLNESSYTVYAYVPQVKFDPKDYMVAEASERDILVYKEIFDYLDSNNNGSIQPMDLRKALMTIGNYHPKKQLVYQIMSDFDTDESGIIEFREFIKMMTIKPCEQDTADDIDKIFNHIDQDYKGYITIEDLKELAEDQKEELTDIQLKDIIRECDPDGKGVIRQAAFLKFNRRNLF